ncbi:hypothetical protein PHYBLDRAFT_172322 [Phycomyces blakesleeanus NRRL 1555(-)]|uniref:Uncharacterized protein n=1 Tax=Phycomyces blakesleeanus (strain ATCC 8743b / DSM 1359 / FGSC 10004 / NBRC 33097 / NRRL 1555) TaxID=763407 RepID=A0A167L694_PHYB8|nr:hypothetical protein PHYBLDRAFT_172322 [Phycomyces blakesleeanus NRRL 1555(-)]OAD69689.1 hypothetical protein PHYBLDRAFT_172322 [Phycomyces blakesleeanus NRRL 1555(-)]|eukprot:XP_018287729.1 hypothetical protein PHYBLDRAFT_172322 [Phycomyces blakesleeanus NRRL 1555(-)]
MGLQRLQFLLYVSLLAFIPKCYAPPIQQEINQLLSSLPIVSILRTILLGYMTHVVTLRPRTGITELSTNYRRFMALIYPSGGIGLAVGSVYKAFYGDRILGITQYQSLLKDYEKESKSKEVTTKENSTQDSTKGDLSDQSFSADTSTPEFKEEKDKGTKVTEYYKRHLDTVRLRDRLVKDMKTSSIHTGKEDNAAYLAAFLHVIGREKAKKTKHCILNGSLIIGFDYGNKFESSGTQCLTEEIITNGPGAICEYQRRIEPIDARYMTADMIDQLDTVHNTDETSYVEIFVTIGQLFYTTIECMDIDGDRWAKLIIIVYTAMSILQTFSLIVLHKQTTAFSIKDDKNDEEEDIVKEDGLSLTEEDRESVSEDNGTLKLDDIQVSALSTFLGMIVSLIIGVWANYNSHSTVEWLVIAWILSPLPLATFFIFCVLFNFNGETKWANALVSIFLISSTGCLIAATIIGYLP